MDDYFIFNPLTKMYYSGEAYNSFKWTASYSKIKLLTIEEARKVRRHHFDNWGEDAWIVLFEPIG